MTRFRKILSLICLLWMVGTGLVWADVIRLKSGKTIEGTILFEDAEVVVIRDATGARYQYPKSELVVGDEAISTAEKSASPRALDPDEEPGVAKEVASSRKVSMGISAYGGAMVMPGQMPDPTTPQWGGHAGSEVMVGTSDLFRRRIFLGGSVGYQAYIIDGKPTSFIPIKLRAEVPLMLAKHAPMLAMGVGYGIGLQGTKGGLCADVTFGWRYAFSRNGAFFLGAFADFQGAEVKLTETVSDKQYISRAYRNLCGMGAKMAVFF